MTLAPGGTSVLDLTKLTTGQYGLVPAVGGFYALNAAVSFHVQGHQSGVEMHVVDRRTANARTSLMCVQWELVTERAPRNTADLDEAAEYGAYGVAVCLICEWTGFCVERSVKGTGIDYWVGTEDANDSGLFQEKARLEVSGRRKPGQDAVRGRIRRKERQTDKSAATGLPAYVVVVDFPTPASHVVMK